MDAVPRPKCKRCIHSFPDYWCFSPEDVPAVGTVAMTLDEFEALRLIDLLQLTQEECAEQMGVSRATVAGIYQKARLKTADALVNGKRLCIAGGTYSVDTSPHYAIPAKEKGTSRIAVPEDRGMISKRFGRAERFSIHDVCSGSIIARQTLESADAGHGAMALLLRNAGVDTVICGGIGANARAALTEAGITFFPGVEGKTEDAVLSFLRGELLYDPDARCSCRNGAKAPDPACGSDHTE